jgi:hypothetical protein
MVGSKIRLFKHKGHQGAGIDWVSLRSTQQAETTRQLRAGILALAERESIIQDIKVPTFKD